MKPSNKRVIHVILPILAVVLPVLYLVKNELQKELWVTVLVHGSITAMLKPPSPNLMVNLLRDRLEGTLYEKATRHIRNNPYFTEDQPMQAMGLQKITKQSHDASFLFSRAFEQVTYLANKQQKNSFYTYGWSGIVGKKIRYQDSLHFYQDLQQEIAKLHAQGIYPKIRIIGFSHGGAVSLDLARVQKQEKLPQTFFVDELILVGTPINRTMKPLLHSHLFKKIYNLYSLQDNVQKLDLLAPGGIFSHRIFTEKRGKKLPKTLKQIEMKIMVDNKEKGIITETSRFDSPYIISGSSPLLDDMSPRHLETWFFGWTDRGYRKNFPFYPLPFITLLPTITHVADTYGDAQCTVDIRPEHNKIIVKNKNKKYAIINLFPKKKHLHELLSLVPTSSIIDRTTEAYWNEVNLCIAQAKKEKLSGNLATI